MEKQMKEETIMEENKKKNPDSERKSKLVSAILMAFVCVVMMGGGTYAWFTMNNVARVESLKLNVASEGNLYISKTNDFQTPNVEKKSKVTWFDAQDTAVKTLYPCTTSDGVTMKKPVYESDTVVSGIEAIEDSEKPSYYLEQTFWLYLDDGITGDGAVHSDYSVQLAKRTSTTDDNKTTYDGTYFQLADGVTATQNPERCVRVSFTPEGGSAVVYEPNYDTHNTGSQGTDYAESAIKVDGASYTPISAAHSQSGTGDSSGSFIDTTANTQVLGDSKELFTIKGGTPKMVVVRVWFEGTDTDCQNNIELKDIMAQLKFVANKATTP